MHGDGLTPAFELFADAVHEAVFGLGALDLGLGEDHDRFALGDLGRHFPGFLHACLHAAREREGDGGGRKGGGETSRPEGYGVHGEFPGRWVRFREIPSFAESFVAEYATDGKRVDRGSQIRFPRRAGAALQKPRSS